MDTKKEEVLETEETGILSGSGDVGSTIVILDGPEEDDDKEEEEDTQQN